MKERVSVTPKIMELNDSNDIYMTMHMVILSSDVNLNNAQFTDDFIEGVVENKERFVGIPFLVNREKLESGEFDNLTHELDQKTGELKTDQVGSFIDFWQDEVDGAECLMGSIRIFKRFPETASKIVELVESGELETSCEVMVSEYQEVSDSGVRKIHYNDGKNALIGSAIVTDAAEKRSKPTLLIAEAYKKDVENIIKQEHSSDKGGVKVTKESKDKIEVYNKDKAIKVYGDFELSELKLSDLEKKIYNLLNPVDVENGGRDYNYYILEMYTDSVVVADWNSGSKLEKIFYSVEGTDVTLASKEDWISGSYGFIPDGVSIEELMSQNSEKVKELEKELGNLREEKENMSKDNKVTVEELQEKITVLETEIADLKETNSKLEETIVSQKEEVIQAEETVQELNGTIEELSKYKEQVETAEKEAKMEELSEKFSKLLDEELFNSKEVSEAIENLDETALNSIVVAEIEKKKEDAQKEVEIAEKDVIVTAGKSKGLGTVKDSSYWASTSK